MTIRVGTGGGGGPTPRPPSRPAPRPSLPPVLPAVRGTPHYQPGQIVTRQPYVPSRQNFSSPRPAPQHYRPVTPPVNVRRPVAKASPPPVGRVVINPDALRAAAIHVFQHQAPAQQRAIVQGALKQPNGISQRAVLDYVKRLTAGPAGETSGLGAVIKAPQLGAVYRATAGAPGFVGSLLKNAASDIVNLPSQTVQGLYGVGKEGVQGANALFSGNISGAASHYGNVFHSLADPYINLGEHIAHGNFSDLQQHPVDSALMFMGGKAILGKGVGAVARSGAVGDAAKAAAGTARADLHIGTVAGEPSPVVEARSYSNDAINKAFQVSREKYLRKRGRNPNVAQPAPRIMPHAMQHAFNVGQEAKLHRIADEMTAVRQMAGRQDRARALNQLHKAAPPKAARNVVSHILQGIIRRPDTAVTDATHEINRLKAAQTGKRTVGEIMNRKQVRDLSIALKTPGAFDQAFKAAADIRPFLHSQDSFLTAKGLLDPEQALRSRLFPYAQAHMGATYNHALAKLVSPTHPGGLDTQAILDHLEHNGVPDPAYVGHFPGKVAPHRFYSAYKLARGTIANTKRTGDAFKTGAYDHTFEGLAGQIASRAEAVTKASLHDKVINRLGVVPSKAVLDRLGIKSDNGLLTPAEAQRVAHAAMVDDHGNPIPNATELTPISTAPVRTLGLVKNLQHPSELNNLGSIELKALAHAVEDATTRTDQARNVALVPTAATQRFAQQFAKTDSTMRGIGHITQQFRRTVLPYSTHWMLQIGSEAGIRALLGGALSPHYLADGRRLMTRLEKTDPGRAALQEMVNATFYNKRDPLAVHNPNPNALVQGAKALPPTRAIIAAHNAYADNIGHAMYSLEHNARLMGLGKLAHKEVAEFGNAWKNAVRLQGGSLEHLARRLETNPALVAKLGRQIDDTFGKYNKFSPKVRGAIQSIAPFLPWYLNAAKYVLWHLPVHHPVTSALLASLRQTMNQDVKDGKQLPLGTFAMQELARISPFGIFTPDSAKAGDVLKEGMQEGASVFLPQAMGSLYNLAGVNSFGDQPLKGPGGDVRGGSGPSRAAFAENLAEAFIPLLSKLRQVREGGKPSYGTSTIVSPQPKPGEASASVLNRLFNPFYSFERAKKSGGGGSGTPSIPSGGGSGSAVIPGSGGAGDAVIP